MELKALLEGLHPLERKVIPFLKFESDVGLLVKKSGMQEVEVMRALQWLSNKEVIRLEVKESERMVLGKNAVLYLEKGLPEKRFLQVLEKPLSLNEIKQKGNLIDEEANVCIGLLKRKGCIVSSNGGSLTFERTNEGKRMLKDSFPEEVILKKIYNNESLSKDELKVVEELKRRKDFIKFETDKARSVFLTELGKQVVNMKLGDNVINAVTPELLRSGAWKDKKFRSYELQGQAPKVYPGKLHPLQETMNLARRIFMNMGFKEMEGPLVETAFWCMDSMWIPQDHPARDVQDTFLLPYEGKLPERLAKKVAEVHETGGDSGSKGYGYKWNEKLAKQLLLRTHTTATTFRYLGEKNVKYPAKYFYIGRIFRNEAIDATHLPEFHQSEGFVMDEGLTLRDLMGYIKEFYSQMGIHKIKFKPTYNPYTEPSMEAIGYNEQLGKWVELINSGIFRPESLEPYGIKVPVIAWGLGFERLAMMVHQQNNIRNMLGATADLTWLRNSKVVKRW
ncbi:MAG: phenylalanine--tRNA ligase subunit alpha [Candidatus Nanoarchaeia archaeon]